MSSMSPKTERKLLITGMMRSGTTLLQKAIASHPDIYIEYQPDIKSFIDIKIKYLNSLGVSSPQPLAHYNSQDHYRLDEFSNWLGCQKSSLIDKYFENTLLNAKGIVGSKEVLVEEFVPFYLANGVKCIIVIRDPRDVLTSMHFGSHKDTGIHRPTLFDIRNWRKSIQIARKMSGHPLLYVIKYEDLVNDAVNILEKVFAWLSVKTFNHDSVVRQMSEQAWRGNSSFQALSPFDNRSIGNFREILPLDTVQYIEACCEEEMNWAGYQFPEMNRVMQRKIISTFQEPFEITRKEFESSYSTCDESVNYELNRLTNYQDLLYV